MRPRRFQAPPIRQSAGALMLCALAFISRGAADEHSPAAELASFQVAPGFEVNLFASESNGVVKPIQIRFDARGRLWVIGSTVYPQIEPGEVPNDKVLILEDDDGDGRADRTTVFADGLMIPTGLELGHGGAYIGHGTDLLFLKDHDGDDRVDERRVLLRGFGTGDNHQNINSFTWGHGGELWFSQGLHTRSHVETPWGLVHLEQAGIWRLRPHLVKLEGFYGAEHEPQNPWGFVFTHWGEPIVLAGNNSSPIYPVPGLTARHRTERPTLIWRNGQGRKVSGGDIVGTAHFPAPWQGALIVGGYINNAIWSLRIVDDGAGFALEDREPLLKSTSRNFRPVDVKFGPDGALYICDWYNPIIGHYQASFRHPDRDKVHGRIWRVTAAGRPLTKRPQLIGTPIPQVLNHLASTDRWTRHFAKRVLADRPRAEVLPALIKWIQQPDLSEHALKEALGVFQSHESIAPELLRRLCEAKDPGARAYAAHVVGWWAERLDDPLAFLRPLVTDPDPRVRLQALVACSYVQRPDAVEAAAMVTDQPLDKFLDYAWKQTVFALKPRWLPAFNAGELSFGGKTSRLAALVSADGTPDVLDALRKLAARDAQDAAARERYLRLLIEIGTAEDIASVLQFQDPSLQLQLLPAIAATAQSRNIRASRDVERALRPWLEATNAAVQAEAIVLAGLWKMESFRSVAEALARNERAAEQHRRSAIRAVAAFGGKRSMDLLLEIAPGSPQRVEAAALAGLAALDMKVAARRSAEALLRLVDEAAIEEVFLALLQRQNGAAELVQAFDGRAPSTQAAEVGLRVMSASGRRDERLAALFADAAGFQTEGKQMNPEEIAAFVAEVRARGSSARGQEIYRRAELGCVACHAVRGEGGTIGPDLGALGTAQPLDFIIGAIIEPQKEVKEGYTAWLITTSDGEEHQGYKVRETPESVVLRDALQNKEVHLRRDLITDQRQIGSVMPMGLADTLTRAEFRDLVRYLSELGQSN